MSARVEVWQPVAGQLRRRGRAPVTPGRDSLVPEVDKPTVVTTGTITASLTRYPSSGSSDLVVTTPGTVLSGLDVYGTIYLRAPDVVVDNCRARGPATWSNVHGCIDATHADALRALITNCEVVPQTPSYYAHGIQGHDYTVKWTEIRETVDGLGIFNPADGTLPLNVTAQMNWIHDLLFLTPDPTHSDSVTHNDGIQIQGGKGQILIQGNLIEARYSTTVGSTGSLPDRGSGTAADGRYNWGNLSCIQLTDYPSGNYPVSVDPDNQIRIYGNWLYGGRFGLWAGSADTNVGHWWRNRFDRSQGLQGSGGDTTYTVGVDAAATLDSGTGANVNVYDDTGSPVTVRRNA